MTRLKSCRPSITWYADSWGWVRDFQSIFNVSYACFIYMHHISDEIVSSNLLRPDVVSFLKVCIAHYAVLIRWLCGLTNCSFILSSSRYFLTAYHSNMIN